MVEAWLVYDGECPFCSAYVKYVRVREHVRLHLVNARNGGPLVDEIVSRGLDLDEGMVLKMGDRYYHGADCINVLATLSTRSSTFNRINARMFSSPALARALYPVLRTGRNGALSLLGRRRLKLRPPSGRDAGRTS